MTPPWMDEPPVRTLLAALGGAGIAARFVGGCVRNWLLDRPRRRHRHRRRQAARDGDARARGGRYQGRADRPQARHGDGDRQGPAVRAHDPAARRRDRRPPRRRGLHRRLARRRRAPRLHLQRALCRSPTARSTILRRPRRPCGRPRALHRRSRSAHRRGPPARAALLPLPRLVRPAAARRAELRRLPRAMPARSATCRASASPRNCCACWRRRRRPTRWRRWPRPAPSITGCRNMPARTACAAWSSARTTPTRSAPPGRDPVSPPTRRRSPSG